MKQVTQFFLDDESLTVIGHDKTGKENIWGVTCMFSYSFTLDSYGNILIT